MRITGDTPLYFIQPHILFNPVDNSFSRDVRLTRPTQFQTVFRQGRRLGNPLFSLVVADNKTAGASTARLGLAISRKVAARAVARNRIKRLARETFRARRDTLPAVDIVLMARRGAAAGTRQELRQALMTLFKRLQV